MHTTSGVTNRASEQRARKREILQGTYSNRVGRNGQIKKLLGFEAMTDAH